MDSKKESSRLDGLPLVANLAATAFGMALAAMAENYLLRQLLSEHEIDIDEKGFKEAAKIHAAGELQKYRDKHPGVADSIPTIDDLVARGILTFDR